MSVPEPNLDNLISTRLPEAAGDVLSDNLSGASSPEQLLKMEQAREELTRLQLKQIADVLPAFKQLILDVIQELRQTITASREVVKELLELHKLYTEDVETEFEITKAFQSQIVLIEPVREQGTLPAARPPQ